MQQLSYHGLRSFLKGILRNCSLGHQASMKVSPGRQNTRCPRWTITTITPSPPSPSPSPPSPLPLIEFVLVGTFFQSDSLHPAVTFLTTFKQFYCLCDAFTKFGIFEWKLFSVPCSSEGGWIWCNHCWETRNWKDGNQKQGEFSLKKVNFFFLQHICKKIYFTEITFSRCLNGSDLDSCLGSTNSQMRCLWIFCIFSIF